MLLPGEISNNKSEQFTPNTCTKNSIGLSLGYVCLIDLRNATAEIIQKTLEAYNFLGPSWYASQDEHHIKWELAYLILSSKYYYQLIPNSEWHEHNRKTNSNLQAIPKSEVWIKDKIPLTWIEKVLLVTICEPVQKNSNAEIICKTIKDI